MTNEERSAAADGLEPGPGRRKAGRRGLRGLAVALLCLAVAVVGMPTVTSAAVADVGSDIDQVSGDPLIVSSRRVLTAEEVAAANITGSLRAGKFLDEAQQGVESSVAYQASSFEASNQVYHFGDLVAVVPTANRIKVWEGINERGETVHQVAVAVEPMDSTASLETTTSKWQYAGSHCYTELVGTWKRVVCWQFDKRDNYQGKSDPRPRDYYRLTADVNASALTGSGPNEGFNRAWVEFDPSDDFGGPSYKELHYMRRPKDSLTGDEVAKQTVTYGFSNRFDVKLGAPPVQIGAGATSDWKTSVEKSVENVHPVQRPDPFTGGSMWCRYTPEEFTGTQSVTARIGFKKSRKGGVRGGFYILTGQQDHTRRCPTQL